MNNQKIILISLIMIPILLFCSCNDNKKHTQVNDRIELNNGVLFSESIIYNLGDINSSEIDTLDFCFSLKNIDKQTVLISKVEPSCPCVSITKYSNRLNPTKETKIVGTIAVTEKGKIDKPIFVTYNLNSAALLLIFFIKP